MRMTVINQAAASRRIDQGLHYLLGMSNGGRQAIGADSLLAVVTVMAYLGAYVFPDANLHELKKRLVGTLEPLNAIVDTEAVVEKAAELAQAFRRPWSEEPSPTGERTI
jgi:hypothetical protein